MESSALESEIRRKAKRPLGVWLFSIFYVFSALFYALGWLMVLSNTVPLPSPEKEYYESLSAADYAVTFGIFAVTLVAAVSLFLLRKVAFVLFSACLIVGLLHTAWHFSMKGLGSVMDGASLAGMITQWSILAWVCIYSWRLQKRGLLR
ncbi:hypothetical protein MYX82_10160 [Acidobacteria bacterium AH-259-D05]|nr:hypothetical protein [Acidobacteria bacterium AH-259-D05]